MVCLPNMVIQTSTFEKKELLWLHSRRSSSNNTTTSKFRHTESAVCELKRKQFQSEEMICILQGNFLKLFRLFLVPYHPVKSFLSPKHFCFLSIFQKKRLLTGYFQTDWKYSFRLYGGYLSASYAVSAARSPGKVLRPFFDGLKVWFQVMFESQSFQFRQINFFSPLLMGSPARAFVNKRL